MIRVHSISSSHLCGRSKELNEIEFRAMLDHVSQYVNYHQNKSNKIRPNLNTQMLILITSGPKQDMQTIF